jgi:outer membrane protein TolC
MTLQESVQFALTRNERARISDLNVVVAEAAVEKARVAFLPVVTALGNDIQHAYAPPNNNIGTASLTVTQPVINLPAFPLYAQARKLADAQHDQNVDDRRLLEFAAANAYFTVLNAQDVVTAAQRQLDNSKANLADTQARAESGLTSSNDVTRAQVDTTSAIAEVEKDKGNLDNAFVQLAFALNAPVPSALVPPKDTLAAAEQPPAGSDALVRLSLDRRPDLMVARFQAMAARDYASEPLLRIVPVLGVQGQLAGTTAPTGTHPWNDENIQATLTWTIYDAGNRYADKHSRDAQTEIASLNVQNLARNIDAQVRSAVALLVSAQAQFHIADDTVKYARQNVEETAVLYRQGLAKAIELVDASDSRFTAEVTYAAAEFTMAQAYLNLRQALGLGALGTELK